MPVPMFSSVFNFEQVAASNYNGSEMLGKPCNKILNFVDQCGESLPDSMSQWYPFSTIFNLLPIVQSVMSFCIISIESDRSSK